MISVILASKNGSKWIDRAIASVLAQTEKDIELVIISDGSTDDTAARAENWRRKDGRVRVISLPASIGPGRARDRAIRDARGDLIAIIDDDDVWISKDKLARQKEYLVGHPDCVLAGAAETELVSENGENIKTYSLPQQDKDIRGMFLIRNCFMTSTVMFKKDAYLKTGGFSDMYLAEDYDLWLRMGLVGTLANLAGIEVAYTVRASSASKKRQLEMYRAILDIVKRNRKNYPNAFKGILKSYLRVLVFYLKNVF